MKNDWSLEGECDLPGKVSSARGKWPQIESRNIYMWNVNREIGTLKEAREVTVELGYYHVMQKKKKEKLYFKKKCHLRGKSDKCWKQFIGSSKTMGVDAIGKA